MASRATRCERERITELLQGMTYDSWLYQTIKNELQMRGNWKNAPRGKPDIRNLNGKQSGSRTGLRADI